MSSLISKARGFIRKRKKSKVVDDNVDKNLLKALAKRISALSKKMIEVKIQLHDASLSYLRIAQNKLRNEMSRKQRRFAPSVERRKLPKLAARMRSTTSRILTAVQGGRS